MKFFTKDIFTKCDKIATTRHIMAAARFATSLYWNQGLIGRGQGGLVPAKIKHLKF